MAAERCVTVQEANVLIPRLEMLVGRMRRAARALPSAPQDGEGDAAPRLR